jgi:DNA primase
MATVDEIKSKLDIIEIVGRYAALQKSGRSFKALCPFHNEKTPSFFVFPERQTWRCFGACAAGGDIFTFIMRIENLTFTEALKRLADEAGVVIPSRRRTADEEPIYQANEAAREYFSKHLASEAGIEARAYIEKRRLSSSSMIGFELGLSPNDGHSLRDHLIGRGFKTELVALAGLLAQGQGGRYRDLFRNRLIFPIRDAQSRLVGFGGRALDDATPKYLNTPQSTVFNKSSVLYGMYKARDAIREQKVAVVVEGYMDVIGPHQKGFTNVVASMGTALTEPQVSLLRRHSKQVVLALDPDEAGQEATLRSLESSWRIFQRLEVARVGNTALYQKPDIPELRVATLPQGKDPDEIALADPETWRKLIEGAIPLMEYLFTSLPRRFDLITPEGKRGFAEAVYPIITAVSNPFEQDAHFQRLARMLGISERALQASMGRLLRRVQSTRTSQRRREPDSTSFEHLEHDPLEELCLSLLLNYPDLTSRASDLNLWHFRRIENREVFTCWQRGDTITQVGETADAELKSHLDHILARELPSNTASEREAILVDCLRRLEERRLRELKIEEEMRLTGTPLKDMSSEESNLLELNERLKRLFDTTVK